MWSLPTCCQILILQTLDVWPVTELIWAACQLYALISVLLRQFGISHA